MMNFQNIIQELISVGLSQNSIAEKVNVTQPLISQILNGKTKSCTYEVGNRLIELHKKTFKQKRNN